MKKTIIYLFLVMGMLFATPAHAEFASALNETQIQSILNILVSFGVDNTIINNINSTLRNITPSLTLSQKTSQCQQQYDDSVSYLNQSIKNFEIEEQNTITQGNFIINNCNNTCNNNDLISAQKQISEAQNELINTTNLYNSSLSNIKNMLQDCLNMQPVIQG